MIRTGKEPPFQNGRFFLFARDLVLPYSDFKLMTRKYWEGGHGFEPRALSLVRSLSLHLRI